MMSDSFLASRAIRAAMLGIMVALVACVPSSAQEPAGKVPWWKQEKIRFMWGVWGCSAPDKSVLPGRREVPREVFRNIALSGATVFADRADSRFVPAHARLAKEFGLRYFVGARSRDPLWYTTGRAWVKEDGEKQMVDVKYPFKCPLDEGVYERWLIDPFIEGVRQGLIDGINIDWEAGGLPLTACYCDDCFSKFPAFTETGEDPPAPSERFGWLESRGLVDAYKERFSKRQFAMLTRIRRKLQAANPELLFSQYPMHEELVTLSFSRAMHTPEAPYIFLDARHYTNDDRQPWWESYSRRLREEGYLYIPGGWTNALFGSQPSQVSASRWLYEAAINEDGVWLWFEHELTDDMLLAYSAADRRLRAVEDRVGVFLSDGKRDYNFVTAVEWTGRPDLERAIVRQTYHLGDEHLAHVSNNDCDWPLRVGLRFPRLPQDAQWTVRDPMSGQYYTRDGETAVWTSEDLLAGVVVALDPRTDLFLLVSPADESLEVAPSRLMPSREFDTLPDHETSSTQAGPAEKEETSVPRARGPRRATGRIVYTATEGMTVDGGSGVRTIIGNAIRTVDADGTNDTRVRQLHGHLWSPSYSPDGKRIAFVHDAGGRGQVYVMDADGSNAVNLSDNAFCDRSPVWSPYGTTIAFLSEREGDWDIYVMNDDGSDQHRLAGNPGLDRAPVWSPDGGQIAWESYTSGIPNIWVCDADGRDSHPVIQPDEPLKLQMVKYWLDPLEIVDLEPIFPDNTTYLWDPVWSPDGTRIAAGAIHSAAGETPAVLAADGSSLLQLVYAFTGIDNIVWSPDGKWLAGTWRCAPQESERSGIFVMKADGTDKRKGKCWIVDVSPQGPRLGGASRQGLVTWYSHGSAQPRRVVKTFTSLAWSPDGKTLAFSSDMDHGGAFYVYTISPQGGKPERLDATKSAWPNEINWQPRQSR